MQPMYSRQSRVVPGIHDVIAPPPVSSREDNLPDALFFSFFFLLCNLCDLFDSLHINLLNNVDFPALGGPTIETTVLSEKHRL